VTARWDIIVRFTLSNALSTHTSSFSPLSKPATNPPTSVSPAPVVLTISSLLISIGEKCLILKTRPSGIDCLKFPPDSLVRWTLITPKRPHLIHKSSMNGNNPIAFWITPCSAIQPLPSFRVQASVFARKSASRLYELTFSQASDWISSLIVGSKECNRSSSRRLGERCEIGLEGERADRRRGSLGVDVGSQNAFWVSLKSG